MRFLLDAQLSPKLMVALRKAGHEAEHIFDAGLVSAPDIEIWRYAIRSAAVIVSKDSDFAVMHANSSDGPQLIWLRMGNVTNEALTSALMTALPEIVSAFEAGEKLVELA